MFKKRTRFFIYYLFLVSALLTGMSLSKYSVSKENGNISARVSKIRVDANGGKNIYYTGTNGTNGFEVGSYSNNLTTASIPFQVTINSGNEVKLNYQVKLVLNLGNAKNYFYNALIRTVDDSNGDQMSASFNGTIVTLTKTYTVENYTEASNQNYVIDVMFKKYSSGVAMRQPVSVSIQTLDVTFTQTQ